MKLSLEVKTALLVISGVILFYFGYSYISGNNILDSKDSYHTSFNYNALTKASPVTVKGNVVGKVLEIEYDYASGKTNVSFSVDPKLKFTKKSLIRLYELGVMGGNGLALIISDNGEPAQKGDFLQSEVEHGLVTSLSKNFSGLSSNLDHTLQSTDTLMVNLNTLLTDKSGKGLKSAIAELNGTLKGFKTLSYSANKLVGENQKNIKELLTNFNKISKDFTVISEELKGANLGNTMAELNTTVTKLSAIMTDLEDGKGTAGKILKDDALYENLKGTTKQLEELLQDLKLNPKRYINISVFGKKAKPYDGEGNKKNDK